jgi:hypothetical protein
MRTGFDYFLDDRTVKFLHVLQLISEPYQPSIVGVAILRRDMPGETVSLQKRHPIGLP